MKKFSQTEYTYESYIRDLDRIAMINESFLREGVISLSGVRGKLKDIILAIKDTIQMDIKDIIKALKDRTIFKMLKYFSFSLRKMMQAVTSIDKGIIRAFEELHKTVVLQKVVLTAKNVDKYLEANKNLKKLTGPIIAMLLIATWLNMTFVGNLDYDMDVSSWFDALAGNFSIYELFASPKGNAMLLFLATGIASGGALSFTWLGSTAANLVLALLYAGLKRAGYTDRTKLKEIKKKILREEYIIEGGNAVAGVVPIHQPNSIPTVENIYKELLPLLGLTKKDTALLGSTGKKAPDQSSGDIDLALSAPKLMKKNNLKTQNDIMDYIISRVKGKWDYRDLRQLGIISLGYPIVNANGQQPHDIVQLDLMVMKDVNFAAWGYYGPSYLESKLKGLYRNELLRGIARYARVKVKATRPNKDGTEEPIKWSRLWFDNSKGLTIGQVEYKIGKQGQLLKSTETKHKHTVSTDPDGIVKYLFGPQYKAKDIMTYEQALAAMLKPTFPHRKYNKEIYKFVESGILSRGYPIPDSLKDLLK